ncbi:MAG: helix-turn-helix domain-containing protein [Acholeplasmatales bacterium]|nr:helix-turn-helix domain-containing protein [Acholeplasmatales bacterium]
MSDLKKIIATNLVELRKMKKYTQQDVGNILGYSDKAISKWERGESLPDIDVLYQIADMYEVTLDFLTHEGSYEEKKEYIVPKYEKRNKIIITLLFSTFVWLLVLIIFIYLTTKDMYYWPVFMYGFPTNCIVLIVLNRRWGKRIYFLPIFSVLTWTGLTSFYLAIFYKSGTHVWYLFLLGVPFQIAIVLLSQIKRV